MWRTISLLLATQAATGSQSEPPPPRPSTENLFDLRLSHGPLALENVPLTTALTDIGFDIEHGYVLFAVELRLRDGKEPTVTLDLPRGATLGAALQQVMEQLDGYEYSINNEHLIEICPKGARSDPQDLLNIRVERFFVADQSPSFLLVIPDNYIPELHARLFPAGPPIGSAGSIMSQVCEPRITLDLWNVTVREILNAVSDATQAFPLECGPLGWAYSVETSSVPSGQLAHSWRALYSASDKAWSQGRLTFWTPGSQSSNCTMKLCSTAYGSLRAGRRLLHLALRTS